MKYNKYPACKELKLSKTSRIYKSADDQLCVAKGLNALDFVLWFDETLLKNFVDFSKNPFGVILQFIDNKDDNFVVFASGIKNNYRLACLIYHAFVNCDAERIKNISKEYLIDHPEVKINGRNYDDKLDFDSIFDYDTIKANKLIFPFFRDKDIEDSLVAELLKRRLLAFDNKFRNLIFVGADPFCNFGVEKHGITEKHFMRIEGKKFPFVYWFERETKKDFKNFKRVELYSDTIEMLEDISSKRCSGGIDLDTIYASLHTPNFSEYCLNNLLELCSDGVEIHYNFVVSSETKKTTGEVVLPEKNNIEKTSDIQKIEESLQVWFKDETIVYSGRRHYDSKDIFYSNRDKIYYDSKGKLDDEDLPF